MTTQRSFHHRDFPVERVLAAKAATGLTIDVIVPARDEQDHIGHVVEILHRELVERWPVIDDLVVVDSHSSDATAEIARSRGARVVREGDMFTDLDAAIGKGAAMWSGLAATRGDIVAFVDGDILDIAPRFVLGLVGPLLTCTELLFTKAFYDRPLQTADGDVTAGGGRVTEILARPLLNAFWPELAHIVQPLAGEVAGRRSMLEQLPFVHHYGVEFAMLVDIAATHGVDVIAQCDLDRRAHDHQSLPALGRMSAEILNVAMHRLSEQNRLVLTDAPSSLLVQPVREHDEIRTEVHDVAMRQRPTLMHHLDTRPS